MVLLRLSLLFFTCPHAELKWVGEEANPWGLYFGLSVRPWAGYFIHESIRFLTREKAEEHESCLVESVVEMEGKSRSYALYCDYPEKGKDVLVPF